MAKSHKQMPEVTSMIADLIELNAKYMRAQKRKSAGITGEARAKIEEEINGVIEEGVSEGAPQPPLLSTVDSGRLHMDSERAY